MFKYRCPACGASGLSSASYSTVGVCPACGAALARGATVGVPEPDPVSWADEREAWIRSAYHEIAAGPRVEGGSKMRGRTNASLRLGRWRVQAAEAIDVARWQLERQWALMRRKPWPPLARPAPAPVSKGRRRLLTLPAAVTPARALTFAGLLLAVLSVGAVLQEPDARRANPQPATVGPLIDSLRPEVAAEAAPHMRDASGHQGDEGRSATRESRRSAESRREGGGPRSRTEERESRTPRRSERERVASRAVSDDRNATGRSPAAQSPGSSEPDPVAQQPAAPEPAAPAPAAPAPAAPAPVATAPAPTAPQQEQSEAEDDGEIRGPHPHGGRPGQSGDRDEDDDD